MDTATTLDLSVITLFMEADIFVQGIMAMLLVLSVFVWTIWIAKKRYLSGLLKKAENFEEAFVSGENLETLYKGVTPESTDHPMAKVFVVGLNEWKESRESENRDDAVLRAGTISRVRRRMDATLTRELEKCENGLSFLATVGSTSPFVGLLGTVWGIMNSFQSIAAVKNTSLAIVAPHMAEALLATAMGLFAAIPAVVAYNSVSTLLSRYSGRLEAFTLEFLTILEHKERQEKEKKSSVTKIA